MDDLHIRDKQKSDRMRQMNYDRAAREHKEVLADKVKRLERITNKDPQQFNIEAERRRIHPDSPEQVEAKKQSEVAVGEAGTSDSWADTDNDLLFINPDFRLFADYFGIEKKDYGENRDKLITAYEWGKEQGRDKKISSILSRVKKQERKIGTRPLEARINTFYNWVRFDNIEREAIATKRSFEK
jgi:hypothetical protein